MPGYWKNLIRSLAISFGGWAILPDNNFFIFFIFGNEMLKHYRFWQESQEIDREFKKKHDALMKEWDLQCKSSL